MREKILQLLNRKDFVSGKDLSNILNVSRTAIWKQIKILKKYGYNIESVKNRGYKLVSRPDIPRYEELLPLLKTTIIGKKILYFEKIDSTNIYAKKLANEGVLEGCVVVAGMQEKGRGRKNRIWSSPLGGLWFSVIIYPGISPQNAMIVTMAASISVVETIIKLTNLKTVIKWPNDILVKDKKICGILTELDAEMDRINYMVIGIGINVNNMISKELKDIATSLSIETRKKWSIVELLANLLNNFDKNYSFIKLGKFEYIRNSWLSYSNIIGKKIKVDIDNFSIEGKVIAVDSDGCLIVDTKEDEIRLAYGDIFYV